MHTLIGQKFRAIIIVLGNSCFIVSYPALYDECEEKLVVTVLRTILSCRIIC